MGFFFLKGSHLGKGAGLGFGGSRRSEDFSMKAEKDRDSTLEQVTTFTSAQEESSSKLLVLPKQKSLLKGKQLSSPRPREVLRRRLVNLKRLYMT